MQVCEHSHVINGLCQKILDRNLNPSLVNGSQGVKVRMGEVAASGHVALEGGAVSREENQI